MKIRTIKKSIFFNIITFFPYAFFILFSLSLFPFKICHIFFNICDFILFEYWLICPILIILAIIELIIIKIKSKPYLESKNFDNKYYSLFFLAGLIFFILFTILYYRALYSILTMTLPD